MNAANRIVAMLSALVTPLVTLLVVYNVTTPDQGAAIGGVLAALAVGWHASAAVTNRANNASAVTSVTNSEMLAARDAGKAV